MSGGAVGADASGEAWPDTACQSPREEFLLPEGQSYPFWCENLGAPASVLFLRGCDGDSTQRNPKRIVLYAPGTHGFDVEIPSESGVVGPSGQQKSKALMERLANKGISTAVVNFDNNINPNTHAAVRQCREPHHPANGGQCLMNPKTCQRTKPCGYELDVLRSLDLVQKKFPKAEIVMLGHSMGAKTVSNMTSEINDNKHVIGSVLSHDHIMFGDSDRSTPQDPALLRPSKATLVVSDVHDYAKDDRWGHSLGAYCCDRSRQYVTWLESDYKKIDPNDNSLEAAHQSMFNHTEIANPVVDYISCLFSTKGSDATRAMTCGSQLRRDVQDKTGLQAARPGEQDSSTGFPHVDMCQRYDKPFEFSTRDLTCKASQHMRCQYACTAAEALTYPL
jgi:hypothetical protein